MFAASKTAAVASAANYIEDVFSTYLYTGNGSTQTITNGIDLSGQGGLVWIKNRTDATVHVLTDSNSPNINYYLQSNATNAYTNGVGGTVTSFNSNGFSIGNDSKVNNNLSNIASWTFRKQAKFFDVVTYTGNGVAGRTISHSLGSTPGCIIVKRTDGAANWAVYHRGVNAGTSPEQYYLVLNATTAQTANTVLWNDTAPTISAFTVGTSTLVNGSGNTYVAYLFAHDAGGFGASGTDNVISCGSFTTDASGNATVTLGYEPQWILRKASSTTGNWELFDVMRGWVAPTNSAQRLLANTSAAEAAYGDTVNSISVLQTGFRTTGDFGSTTFIYIAIRRGPMRTPTSGTSVFGLNARTGTGANATVTGGQTDDAVLIKNRGSAVGDLFSSRLTSTGYVVTSSTAAEVAAGTTIFQANPWDVMDGVKVGTTSTITNASTNTFINYLFRRAPGFFDVVCYTGTGANATQTHNLGVAPELWIIKGRSGATAWQAGSTVLANTEYLVLNTTAAKATGATRWNSTYPTSSVFSLGTASEVNTSSATYVAYLFATVAGVSKVGSYTGTGTTLQVDCGFAAGARFVLIKRTDSTGDWYVWDSARGIVAGNDPYLLLNSTAAEVTNTDYVDTYSAGFEISSTAPAAINANGGTFIFLAIA